MGMYVGVKMIQAEPQMNAKGEEGYRVVYPDGYKSWSPKEQFEKAYLPLKDVTRITPDEIEAMIATTEDSKLDPKTTLVRAETVTGFIQYETAACIDPANYDPEIGHKIALAEIKYNLWFALGFVLQWAKYGLKNTPKG